jgi:hypothetical protein
MPYIFECRGDGLDQLLEVFGYADGSVDLDSIVDGRDSSIRLERSAVKELRDTLNSWLDRTWGS